MKKGLVAFCLLRLLLSVDGTAVFVGCTNSPLCLSKPVSYMCSGENGALADDDSLRWRIRNTSNAQVAAVTYTEGLNDPTTSTLATYFETILTSSVGPMESNISFSPVLAIDNYTVECTIVGTAPVTCSLMIIADVLAAPVPNDPNFTSDTLNFSWSPSTSPCLSHYNVNVTSIEYTINTTDTSLSLPVPSTNDTEYSISVVAIDTAGRYMDPVDEKTFGAEVPKSVTDLTLNQTGLSIDVSWNEPPALMFLPVLSYTLHHKVGSDTSIKILAPNTTYIIRCSVVAGSVYTVGVQASNILGVGPIASATISITSVPSPTSTSMTMTNVPTTTMSEATQSTPAPTTPSTGGLNSSVKIGIGVGAAVIVIVIILFFFCCLIWHELRKTISLCIANFNRSKRDSTEPIASVDKKDDGSSLATGQPIYQEAMSSEDIQREAAPTTDELHAQPNTSSIRCPPPQPQSELATYQDPSTIQRTQAPNTDYLYAEVDKKPQQEAVYAQVDKERSMSTSAATTDSSIPSSPKQSSFDN